MMTQKLRGDRLIWESNGQQPTLRQQIDQAAKTWRAMATPAELLAELRQKQVRHGVSKPTTRAGSREVKSWSDAHGCEFWLIGRTYYAKSHYGSAGQPLRHWR